MLPTFTTERLILRPWEEFDREPFARLNADLRVMEYMPHVLSKPDSDALADRIGVHFRQHGFGLCAVELRRDGSFIGFIGLNVPSFDTPFTPCVAFGGGWQQTAGGKVQRRKVRTRLFAIGFETLGLNEFVSFTVPANTRSRRVMEKLGDGTRSRRRLRSSTIASRTSPAWSRSVSAESLRAEFGICEQMSCLYFQSVSVRLRVRTSGAALSSRRGQAKVCRLFRIV